MVVYTYNPALGSRRIICSRSRPAWVTWHSVCIWGCTWEKQLRGEKSLFQFIIPGTSGEVTASGAWNSWSHGIHSQEQSEIHTCMPACMCSPQFLHSLFRTPRLRNGAADIGLGLPTSIKTLDNLSQRRSQTNLIWTIPQMRLSSQESLGCVQLTV